MLEDYDDCYKENKSIVLPEHMKKIVIELSNNGELLIISIDLNF